jgi:26S proteasome regulatory subunit N11
MHSQHSPHSIGFRVRTTCSKRVVEEDTKTAAELAIANVGKLDPKKRLEAEAATLLTRNVSQCLGMALDTVVF